MIFGSVVSRLMRCSSSKTIASLRRSVSPRVAKKLDLYEIKVHLADDHVDERLAQSRGVTKRYITWKSPLNVRVTPDSGKGNPLVFSVRWIFLPYEISRLPDVEDGGPAEEDRRSADRIVRTPSLRTDLDFNRDYARSGPPFWQRRIADG
jgi:hypothetical protein